MNVENLVRMANRIGEFFDSYPDTEEAKHGIAEHMVKFWDPGMRRALFAHLDESEGDGLTRLVVQAIKEQRVFLIPAAKNEYRQD